MTDSFGRKVDYMRVSVTDRCNLRCGYCMPQGVENTPHSQILRNEEFTRICKVAAGLGIRNIRVTGGEPFVRRGVMELIKEIASIPGIENVAVTTNGVLLEGFLPELKNAGVKLVNISLDTLNQNAYEKMTGTDALGRVLSSVRAAVEAGFEVKINCVSLKGFNDGEFVRLARLSEEYPLDTRFIEAMPVGFGAGFSAVSGAEILSALKAQYPDLAKTREQRGFGPAEYYESKYLKGKIGFISAVSHSFCTSCNRVRLTSEGFLKACLYHEAGEDLRGPLRGGASDTRLAELFGLAVQAKPSGHAFGSRGDCEKRPMFKIGG